MFDDIGLMKKQQLITERWTWLVHEQISQEARGSMGFSKYLIMYNSCELFSLAVHDLYLGLKIDIVQNYKKIIVFKCLQ